ncbi:hypothetical protein SDC9_25097 [bioreactor metagenome]|uniref:Uncharacterized protein n=1 Tax=bioreactor metagenome TaxID=1076179 RepID=A0A644UK36_9ZZZZ
MRDFRCGSLSARAVLSPAPFTASRFRCRLCPRCAAACPKRGSAPRKRSCAVIFGWRRSFCLDGGERSGGGCGGVERRKRRLGGKQDRGVAVRIIARRLQHFVFAEGRGRHRPACQHRRQRIAQRRHLVTRAPDHRRPEDRGRGLTKRAGMHLLAVAGDPPVLQRQRNGHGRTAERRALARARIRGGERLGAGDVGRQRQNALRIELEQIGIAHGFSPGVAQGR